MALTIGSGANTGGSALSKFLGLSPATEKKTLPSSKQIPASEIGEPQGGHVVGYAGAAFTLADKLLDLGFTDASKKSESEVVTAAKTGSSNSTSFEDLYTDIPDYSEARKPESKVKSGDPESPFTELFKNPPKSSKKDQRQDKGPSLNLDRIDSRKLTMTPLNDWDKQTPEVLLSPGVSVPGGYIPAVTRDMNQAEVRDYRKENPKPKSKTPKSFQLSWDDYNKLSDSQQAGVDFNTMLVEAREKDLNSNYDSSPAARETYDVAVKEMFGETGGSQVFAPETMALLNKIGFDGAEEGVGSDLDDFLGLKASLKERDLVDIADPDRLDLLKGLSNSQTDREVAVNTKGDLSGKTSSYEQLLADTDKMKGDFLSSARFDRNDELRFFGGTVNDVKVPTGFGATEVDNFFRSGFDALAETSKNEESLPDDVAMMMSQLKQNGQLDDFLKYADMRSRQALDYGVPLLTGSDLSRDPKQFRQLLGLDKVGE